MTLRSRALLATLLLALHLAAIVAFAHLRFHVAWNDALHDAPSLATPDASEVEHWNRLVVARWDAAHYVNLALRGYSQCHVAMPEPGKAPQLPCDVAFYPGYPLLARVLAVAARMPVDYALWAISLAASWLFLFLWTSAEIIGPLGKRATLVALACFNLFTTGFTVVTIQTEPLLLVTTLGAFVLARRRAFVLAAIVAGAATGVRVSGAATGVAMAALLLVQAWRERPLGFGAWARRVGLVALSFWGLAAMCVYHAVLFGDPLAYFHAHEAAFGHAPSLTDALVPEVRWLLASMASQLHEGVFFAAAILWFALGHKESLRRFDPAARAYWYALTAGVLGVSTIGSVSRGLVGMNRYALVAIPIFFAMGKLLERRRLALVAWLGLSAWHYWNVDLCYYVGDRGDDTVRACEGLVCRLLPPPRPPSPRPPPPSSRPPGARPR